MALNSNADKSSDIEADVVNVRIRRGAHAIGVDGELGTVQQIVVDQNTGELRGVVVRRASDGAEFELPVDLVTRATGGKVQINLLRADLDGRPDVARPYNPEQYIAVQPGDTAPRIQATQTAQTTEHPVLTSVEDDAANLIASPNSRPRADVAVDEALNLETRPRVSKAPRGSSAVAGSNTPMPEIDQTEDASTQFDTQPRRQPRVASTAASPDADDLSDLTDDELSNPDAALINPLPGAVERIARPFVRAASSPDDKLNQGTAMRSEQDRAGMESAFRTATNSSADDTHVIRDPALAALREAAQAPADTISTASAETTFSPYTLPGPTAVADHPPTEDNLPTVDQSAPVATFSLDEVRAAPTAPSTPAASVTAQRNSSAQVVVSVAAAIVVGDTVLRLLGLRRLRVFSRGALLGAALALVLAPMPGARLRAQLADAAARLRTAES